MPIVLSRVVRLETINIETGVTSASVIIASTSGLFNPQGRCVYTDGLSVYVSYTDGTNEKIAKCVPNGNTFTIEEAVTAPFLVADADYDGMFFWCCDATNVYQATDWKFSNVVNSWAHGSSGHGLFVRDDRIVMEAA